MKSVKGFMIVDENGKYVVGYVKDYGVLKYIAHNKSDSCAIRLILDRETVMKNIQKLNEISCKIGDNHIFTYEEVF